MLNNLKSRLAGKNYYLFLTLIFTLLITGLTLAQETTVKLPTMDNTSSFNVTKSDNANLLKLNADGGFLLEGYFNPNGPGSGGYIPKEGPGARLMWYPARSAFRAGYVSGTEWDVSNIGINSTAMGNETTASGLASTAMGYGTTAQAYASTAIGRYNVGGGTTDSWVISEPLFVCGNGSYISSRSNALTLYKNGNMTIAGTLTENSDIRLKENINPLNSVLSSLNEIDPVFYEFKNKETHPAGRHIGLIAQEVKDAFPELVAKDSQGYLSVEYTKLTAVLLQAIKEQQKIIDELTIKVETLLNE